jgi:hypothetical protein
VIPPPSTRVLNGRHNLSALRSKFDDTRGNGLKTGGYLHLPKDTHHYEWNTEDTVIQLSGTGPDRDDLP